MKLAPDEIRAILEEENPEALLYDGLDSALIGLGRRCGQPTIAVYSYAACVAVFAVQLGYDGAVEWMEFNVVGGWLGPHTPMVVTHCD
jgi:hypothetical protein